MFFNVKKSKSIKIKSARIVTEQNQGHTNIMFLSKSEQGNYNLRLAPKNKMNQNVSRELSAHYLIPLRTFVHCEWH